MERGTGYVLQPEELASARLAWLKKQGFGMNLLKWRPWAGSTGGTRRDGRVAEGDGLIIQECTSPEITTYVPASSKIS